MQHSQSPVRSTLKVSDCRKTSSVLTIQKHETLKLEVKTDNSNQMALHKQILNYYHIMTYQEGLIVHTHKTVFKFWPFVLSNEHHWRSLHSEVVIHAYMHKLIEVSSQFSTEMQIRIQPTGKTTTILSWSDL